MCQPNCLPPIDQRGIDREKSLGPETREAATAPQRLAQPVNNVAEASRINDM